MAKDYIHREHMYQPWLIRHRKLKWGLAISSMVVTGGGLPFVVAWWQQKRAGLMFPPPTPDPSRG